MLHRAGFFSSNAQHLCVNVAGPDRRMALRFFMRTLCEHFAVIPTRTQLKMALNGLGWARLDEPFRRAIGSQSLERAMAGLAIKPGLLKLIAEQLEAHGVEFREDGSVRVPEHK